MSEPQVRAMFDRIAGVYDLMNSVMTAGLHHRWRARAADLAAVGPGARALDVATGTGDLAIELARRVGPGGEVVGSDFSEKMLGLARRKAPALRFEWGNALELPYPDGAFDAATVGFGARNFSDLDRGLSEMARVVRPGGTVALLEFGVPRGIWRPPWELWVRIGLPAAGRFISPGWHDVGRFLGGSIRAFDARWPLPRLVSAWREAGFGDVQARRLSLGGCVVVWGRCM
jgi:demethylmenaquinone methyltransferase/2-methoxy-6-polyprenyl-1,4-benzoquinol methylase